MAANSVYYVHLCCGLIYLFTVVGAPPDDLHLYLQGSTRLDETICPQTQTALQETGGQKGTQLCLILLGESSCTLICTQRCNKQIQFVHKTFNILELHEGIFTYLYMLTRFVRMNKNTALHIVKSIVYSITWHNLQYNLQYS